jgi:hypothetical protein
MKLLVVVSSVLVPFCDKEEVKSTALLDHNCIRYCAFILYELCSTILQPIFSKTKTHLLVQYHFVAPFLKNRCLLVQYNFKTPFLKYKDMPIGTVTLYSPLS